MSSPPNITVRTVLFGDADPAGALTRSPGWQGVVGSLGAALGAVSPAGRKVVEREISTSLAGLLHLDVATVLLTGWRKHNALVAAAHHTQSNPAATEVVQLAAHRITTGHRPYLDVMVNGVKVATLHFDLSLTFDIDGVLGTVRQARLVAIRSGRCTVTAALGFAGRDITSRSLVIDPALAVPLGQGIALLHDEPQPTP